MRLTQVGLWIGTVFIALAGAAPAHSQEVVAGAPFDVSVTVYRDPYRDEGGFDIDDLYGFALITESRRVVLPPGEHRLRFEGVADAIEPASAIVTGLPSGVVEKNRDGALLSPSALIASTQVQSGRVILARANPASGTVTRTEGTIRAAADGVVFETADGVEGLRCSGLPEAFAFASSLNGLSALPTLSVLTRTTQQVEAVVQLSYLSRSFDWAADYVVDMTADGKLDLGAWVTLANGNGTGFPDARVQIVAGRLNRETGDVEPLDIGQPVLATCWPQGSTSDTSPPITIERAFPLGFDWDRYSSDKERIVVTASMRSASVEDAALPVSAYSVEQAEDLGDLKLYRVPDRTTLASRQSKQVRLLDRDAVPAVKLYEADLQANQQLESEPMTILLRTQNSTNSNLGLPLPSGRVSLFETIGNGAAEQRLLSGETGLRDIAVDEEVELRLSGGPDVQVRQTPEQFEHTSTPKQSLRLLPGVRTRDQGSYQEISVIEISNALAVAVAAEVRLYLEDGQHLVKADHRADAKNGRPIFRARVPANSTLRIRYQTATD